MHSSYRGLAFLLSLGSLPIACTRPDNDDDTGGDTTTPGTNPTTGEATDPTSTPTTTPDATTSSTGDTQTGGTETGGTATVTTTAPTTGSDPRDSEEPPPATDPTCLAYAEKFVECEPRYARYQEQYAQQCELYKEYGFRADGQMCLDALEALYVCLSMADCAEEGACAAENMAIAMGACPSFGG
jgi:hypothetical protein